MDSPRRGSAGAGDTVATRSATGSCAQAFEYVLVRPPGEINRFGAGAGAATQTAGLQAAFYESCVAIRRVLQAKRLISPTFRSAASQLGQVYEHGVLLELDRKPGVWVIGRLFEAGRALSEVDEFYVICEDGTPDSVIELGFAMLRGPAA